MKENILVIGGTGFIGYNFLKKNSLKKFNLYSFSTKLPTKFNRVKNVKYLKGNIKNLKLFGKYFKNEIHHVINLSGYINHKKKNENNLFHYIGCKNLVNFFKLKKIKTFIQVGSSLEYGNLNSPQIEKFKCNPKGYYGQSKFKASKFIQKIGETYNFPYVILRPYQIYGPYQKKNRLIPETIDACLKNKKFGCTSGVQLRDFLYIDDFIRLLEKILISKKKNKNIYNVGSGKPVKVKHVIKMINNIIGHGSPQFGKFPMRKEEVLKLYPSIKKIKKHFNWRPSVDLKSGLKKTINFYARKF